MQVCGGPFAYFRCLRYFDWCVVSRERVMAFIARALVEDEADVGQCKDERGDVGGGPAHVEADLGLADPGAADEGVEERRDERHPDEAQFLAASQEDGNTRQCEQSQGLVGPCEVVP